LAAEAKPAREEGKGSAARLQVRRAELISPWAVAVEARVQLKAKGVWGLEVNVRARGARLKGALEA